MEWNWNGNWNVIPSLQLESSGDSEELLKPHVQNHHQEKEKEDQETHMDGCYQGHDDDDGDDDGDDDDDDDAQSCSYDHPSYVNTRLYGNRSYQDDIQTTPRGFVYDNDDDDGDDGDDGDGEVVDDGKMKKVIDPCISNQFCHQFCGDSCSHEREMDRKFWETCLAT
ncbi:hypothetical protein OSB04_022815 [Centaurea solstitialis]|uniref:Uncharacterized protein n=1 Tax=Centaurea solstitialis TaxID=347529 RepID=A0AA38SQG7_9ASTR|nr:hypothetical protein OSB04_022815 [Centaurea solstitialis]